MTTKSISKQAPIHNYLSLINNSGKTVHDIKLASRVTHAYDVHTWPAEAEDCSEPQARPMAD